MSQTTKITLSNDIHGLLYAAAFVLVAVQGYLQTSPLVAGHPYLALLVMALPAIIALIKTVSGTTKPGTLTQKQADLLIYAALALTAVGFSLSNATSDPNYLLVFGLIGAVAAGLKGFLGSMGITVPATAPPV